MVDVHSGMFVGAKNGLHDSRTGQITQHTGLIDEGR
jgi:hypothetical protein